MICLFKGTSLTSRLIRYATWSQYSHAAWLHVEDPDVRTPGYRIIEAWHKRGVRVATPHDDHTPGTVVDVFRVQGETPRHTAAIRKFLLSQVGKPYDLRGALGFVTRARAHQNKWFCSELVFAAYATAGISLLARTPAYKVSPGALHRSPLLIFDHTFTTMP